MIDAVHQVTQEFLHFEYFTAYDINDGGCEDWADAVMERLKDTAHDVQLWATLHGISDTSHVFLRIDGKFYDAECLDGCDDHMELPIFARIGKRQPVWLEDHNGKFVEGGEHRRDLTEDQVKEYHRVIG